MIKDNEIFIGGVREYKCKYCYAWHIDDKGNVDEPFTCWACWQDKPDKKWKWYLRRFFLFIKRYTSYDIRNRIFSLLKQLDSGLWRYL